MEKLDNPPIIEAQIGFKLSKALTLESMTAIAEKLKFKLPSNKPRFEIQATIKTEAGKFDNQDTVVTQQGFQLTNDRGFVFIIQKDLVIFCTLNPYPGWEAFKAEAIETSNLFIDQIADQKITEFFSRYINLIKLNTPTSLEKYFTFLPVLPPLTPEMVLTSFNYQFHATQNETGFKTSISFFPRPHFGQTDTVELVLDLGVAKSIDQLGINQTLWDNLEGTRKFKNDFFKGLTTDELRARYKIC